MNPNIDIDVLRALFQQSSATMTARLIALIFLTTISLSYAIRLSTLSNQVKILGQELTILRARLEAEHGPADTA